MEKKAFKIGYIIEVVLCTICMVLLYFNFQTIESNPIELNQIAMENSNGQKYLPIIGKPVVLNFWAIWCVPCIKEFPEFEEAKITYNDKINIIMLTDETNEEIDAFKNKNKYTLILFEA